MGSFEEEVFRDEWLTAATIEGGAALLQTIQHFLQQILRQLASYLHEQNRQQSNQVKLLWEKD